MHSLLPALKRHVKEMCITYVVSNVIHVCRRLATSRPKLSVHDRSLKVATVIESLEMEMELLCLTGVEDQLQADVRPTLEILRNAGIKVSVGTHKHAQTMRFHCGQSYPGTMRQK